ncbi:MAG TPA: AMP-ligase, partial [Rhodanobacteraceae bacterium]|nr:AMP-ligase [Rhodanobacteraceae bacterium]
MSVPDPSPAMTQPVSLPLLGTTDAARSVAWRRGRVVSAGEFLAHVDQVARQLPPARHVINLCEDRYAFLVAFCAALARGQTNLLPPSRAPQAVADILAAHPDGYTLSEQPLPKPLPGHVCLPTLQDADTPPAAMPM